MIRMKAKLQAPRLNMSKYNTVLEKVARELLSRAVFEYVVTAQSIIPVWTGASITTLTDLAKIVGLPLVVTPTGSAATRPNLVNKMQAKARSRSKAELNIAAGQFSFSYQTSLPHLVYNEYHNANIEKPPELFSELKNPGPYNFQQHTKQVVSVVLKQFVLPDPRDHITIKKVSVR